MEREKESRLLYWNMMGLCLAGVIGTLIVHNWLAAAWVSSCAIQAHRAEGYRLELNKAAALLAETFALARAQRAALTGQDPAKPEPHIQWETP